MGKQKFIVLLMIFILSISLSVNAEEIIEDSYLGYNDETEILEPLEELIEDEVAIDIKKFDENGIIIREGIVGSEVLRVKKFFKVKGYSNITEDYQFDSRLKDVILNYQLSHGLIADGTIGKDTYKKINEHMEFYKMSIPEISILFTTDVPDEFWIIINKSNNNLYHLKGSEVINRYNVATGKTPLHTPEGKFSIITKYINPSWGGAGIYRPIRGGAANNPLGKRWMGLSIGGGSTYGIHGNADVGSIGKYVSLGCIRMFNQDAEYLYDLIYKGTPVWIGDENKLEEYGVVFN